MRTLRLVLLLLFQVIICSGATLMPNVEALQQIPKLSQSQVALIATNSAALCNLMPLLCGWQLHLYEGHSFSVQHPSYNRVIGESPASTSSTTETPPIPQLFSVPGGDNSHKLLIYAQVESRATNRKPV